MSHSCPTPWAVTRRLYSSSTAPPRSSSPQSLKGKASCRSCLAPEAFSSAIPLGGRESEWRRSSSAEAPQFAASNAVSTRNHSRRASHRSASTSCALASTRSKPEQSNLRTATAPKSSAIGGGGSHQGPDSLEPELQPLARGDAERSSRRKAGRPPAPPLPASLQSSSVRHRKGETGRRPCRP